MPNKTLKFKPELVKLILAGQKNCTWRLFDDKGLKAGDVLDLIDSSTKEKFSEAEIIHLYEKKMADLTGADFEGHEKFADKEEMYRTYRTYYGEKVGPDTAVKIIKFKMCESISQPETIRLAKIIWDYHHLDQKLDKADAIWVLGSSDTRIAEKAAELYLEGWAPLMIFSGGRGRMTKDMEQFSEGEANVFAGVAVEKGVPKDKIVIEDKSTNTGENIIYTKKLLNDRSIRVKKLMVVQKPYMERRAYAAIKKQWPEIDILVTSPQIPFEHYPTEQRPMDYLINAIVADVQRMKVYAEKGFQIPQEIPGEVWEAYESLVEAGYDKFLV